MRGGRRPPVRARGDRDHEPARDDPPLGARDGDGRSRPRSSGRTGAPPSVAASCPPSLLRARTGLVPDPYFSATKLEWLLARTDVPRSELAFGTVDSWLVWKLTGGRVHATDLTNASRTMLLDLDSLDWSDELLDLFGVDRALLPRLVALVRGRRRGGAARRHAADRGDRRRPAGGALRARLLRPRRGEGDLRHRQLRARERGRRARAGAAGLLETVAASGGYALEGAILASGAAIQWLRDGLGILADADESERLARSVESTGGVYFVPALAGLGSPHWDAEARGLISGHHAWDDPRPPRPRRARGDRVPGRGRARRASRAASRCCAPTAARARTAS